MKIALVCPDGHSVVLFCKGILGHMCSLENAEVLVVCSAGKYRGEIEALNVRCIDVDIHRFFNPARDMAYAYALYRVFRREKLDIVFNFSTKPNIYGTIAAKFAGIRKIIIHVVGLGSAFMAPNSLPGIALKKVFLGLYRIACAIGTNIWFTNKNDVSYFLDRRIALPGKVVLTRNYLNIDDYSLSKVGASETSALRKELKVEPGDVVVLMVARMIWAKGIREYAEAAVQLRDNYPFVRFILVAPLEPGSPDSVPASYIEDIERRSNLRWLGFRSDIVGLYALCDVAVAPTYYKEGGYPRSLLEPMALGKPVIAADSDDCRGAVDEGRNGLLVPIKNAEALASAIEILLNDETKRVNFGRHSRRKVEMEFDERLIIANAFRELGLGA